MKSHIFDGTDISIEELVVSQEAIEDILRKLTDRMPVVGNVTDFVADKFGMFQSYIRTTCNNISNNIKLMQYKGFVFSTDMDHKVGFVKNLIKDVKYSNYDNIIIVIPESYHVGTSLADFAAYCRYTISFMQDDLVGPLAEYRSLLGSFINNEDTRISTKDHNEIISKIKTRTTDLQKEYHKYFPTNTNQTRAKLGKVYPNLNAISDFITEFYYTDKLMRATDLSTITGYVREVAQYLDIIIKNTKDGTINKISPESAKAIGAGVYEIAKYIELYSGIYFKAINLLATAEDTMYVLVKDSK
jgi:hypothetical protein